MENPKFKFLKQWFTFTFNDDNKTDLVFNCSNNHYIHDWMEEHGYNKFKNTLSTEDLDLFIRALNESSNMIPDDFDLHFSENENYTLWNMEIGHYWSDVEEYREHAKEEMETLFNRLNLSQDSNNETTMGVLKYNIYY
jgi:hypothetical protein